MTIEAIQHTTHMDDRNLHKYMLSSKNVFPMKTPYLKLDIIVKAFKLNPLVKSCIFTGNYRRLHKNTD